jgi:predicted PurR-regulated permease PerM
MQQKKLIQIALILVIVFLGAMILKYGKPFLVPIAFAALISMLLLPISQWLQRKGVNKAVAIILSMLVFVGFFVLVGFFISWQVTDLSKDASDIERQFTTQYDHVQKYITEKLGISKAEQNQMMKEQQASTPGKLSAMISGLIAGVGGLLTDMILVLVYIFLFTYFRNYLKRFVIRMVPQDQESNAQKILHRSQKVTQKYLTGMALMIVGLWIMYGIGFSIVGVKNAIFFAILCGLLEIVPFVGNLIGTGLTIIMALAQGGGMNMVLGVVITYAVVQFLQSYILEPLVVGSEVNLNPLFTILSLIAGEFIWGIPGMILAIPVMGVVKIVCDNVEPLQPYGQLIGEDKKEDGMLKKKAKSIAKKIRGVATSDDASKN